MLKLRLRAIAIHYPDADQPVGVPAQRDDITVAKQLILISQFVVDPYLAWCRRLQYNSSSMSVDGKQTGCLLLVMTPDAVGSGLEVSGLPGERIRGVIQQ